MITHLEKNRNFLESEKKKIMDFKVTKKELEQFGGSCVQQNLSTANEARYRPFQSSGAVDGRHMWVSRLARQQEEVGEL